MPYTLQLDEQSRKFYDTSGLSPRKLDIEHKTNSHLVKNHSYETTRHFHESNKPCYSPFCGVCYDDFIPDLLSEQEYSKSLGLLKKLSQSSIKRLEDKYGYHAYQIFRNKIAQLQCQQRKRKIEYLVSLGITNCIDPHNEKHVHDLKCTQKIK